jgi:hypothetical protein
LDYVWILSTITWYSVSAHAIHRPSLVSIGDVFLGRVNESFMVYEVDQVVIVVRGFEKGWV